MTAASELSPLKQLSDALAGLVAAAGPSLVAIHSHRALSSGFVWKPGLIVTADEALAEEGDVTVAPQGGKRVAASIVGRDPTTDVALLRTETAGSPPVTFGDGTPSVGALAVAVGAHDGGPMAALGIVAHSGPAWRSMRGGEIDARIELDLSLRREAEGGIVLGPDGRAFGMAVLGPRRRVLVIPAATIDRVATQLEARGRIARGYLGLGLQPVRLDRDEGVGAMVMSVDADGPGARAGIHQGDVIVAWKDRPVVSVGAVMRALGPDSVGTSVALTLRRGGETRPVTIEIGERR